MQRAVDDYNDANPPVGGFTYDSFPWRGAWLRGTVGHLLRMAAHRYRRNALRYSAGGLTVQDQEKFLEYDRAAEQAMAEYLTWVQRKKVSININSGYGSVGPSPYGRRGLW
ncbi:MAG: hypothetical protein DRP45_12410 [Candidatus Zixiibacteriota bacterium]|nr:MAG: hypothetical protein DRP45_12410 [candidate division Zixibacteria bacterium]